MSNSFRLRGFHVLLALLAFFGAVIMANVVFVSLAVRSFPGQDVEKSYLQGLHFNDEIAARERQTALGWSARIVAAHLNEAGAVIEIAVNAASGEPLGNLFVSGELRRPASSREDRKLVFTGEGSGRYRADAPGLNAGAYDLLVVAASPAGDEFRLAKRLLLK